MTSTKVVRYSEAFKLSVIGDLESGRFGNPAEAARAYGVKSANTVRTWVRKYGRETLLRKVVRVEKPGEKSELKRLRDRVRRLESSLADAHMDSALDEAFFDLLCESTGTDADAFKKKHAAELLKRPGKSSGRGRK